MKEQNGSEKKKKERINGEKKFYLFTAIGCAAVLLAVIVVAVAVTNNSKVNSGLKNPSSNSSVEAPLDSADTNNSGGNHNDSAGGNNSSDKPVSGAEEMIMPMSSVTVSNDYGFYHNQTLNSYYEHKGVDFVAEVGAEVLAAQTGVVESIYKEDLLSGTEITIDHGNGLKTVYRFVTEAEGLKIGQTVERGEVIATVAEANGDEYKDGAHLHFEILQDGKHVDPAVHLTLEEK